MSSCTESESEEHNGELQSGVVLEDTMFTLSFYLPWEM